MKSQSGNVRILRISTVAHSRRRVVLKRVLIHDGAEKGQFSAHRSRGSQVRWYSVQINPTVDNLQG